MAGEKTLVEKEQERIFSILKTLLKQNYSTKQEDDFLLAQKDGELKLFTFRAFPPTPTSAEFLAGKISEKRPSEVVIITFFEDWKDALSDSLSSKGIKVSLKVVSPLDVAGMLIPEEGISSFVEHVGIAVRSSKEAVQKIQKLLGIKPSGEHKVETEGLVATFIWFGQTRFELLEPFSPDSAVASFLEKRGEGIHHVAIQVENFDKVMERAKELGMRVIGPRQGATGKRVFFIHPKDFFGVLLEIVEKGYREVSLEED